MAESAETHPAPTQKIPSTVEDVLRRVKGEFMEMPGLRLTEPQARRLWGLDAATCSELLAVLIEARFLARTFDGAFMRREQTVPLKAGLLARVARTTAA